MPHTAQMRRSIAFLLGITGIVLGFHSVQSRSNQASPPQHHAEESQSIGVSNARSVVRCPDNLRQAELEPLGSGPARLVRIHCVNLPGGQESRLPNVSPDGRFVAFWDAGQISPLDVMPFDGRVGVQIPNRVTFRTFGSGSQIASQDALHWRSDSAALWSVEQQVVHPSGFALSGLTPILIDHDGNVQRLTSPQHASGPLDALAWIGGDGRALAQFGTRGGYYRPEHEDRSPTLAMIDVPSLRILDTLTAADSEDLGLRVVSSGGFGLFDVSTVQLRDGRLRALLRFQRIVDRSAKPTAVSARVPDRFIPAVWLVWTQSERPVRLSPTFDDRSVTAEFSPDGYQILAWRPVQPEGVRDNNHCRDCPPPPPPTPVDGVVATLVDTHSGRPVWTLNARASEFWSHAGRPVINPTGRTALIALPATENRQVVGLLSMTDGRVLQRFSLTCNGCLPQSFGFTGDGRQMWIATANHLAFYDLR